jgi:hypothetical protein
MPVATLSATIGVELLSEYPRLLLAVAVLARLARAWQSTLTWPEYRAAHRLKRGVFPLADRVLAGRALLVSEKGGRDDAEFLATSPESLWAVARRLRRAGGSPHLLNSLKRRPGEHGDRLSGAHLVWTHENGEQTEAYLFANRDGTTDVYAHSETSVDEPLAHLTDEQHDGDPRGVVPARPFDGDS